MNVYEALVKAGKVEDNKTLLLLQLQNDEWTYSKDYNLYNDFKAIDNAKNIICIVNRNNNSIDTNKWVDCLYSAPSKYWVDQVYLDIHPHSGNYMLTNVNNANIIDFIKKYKPVTHNNHLLGVAFKTYYGDIKYLSKVTGYEGYMLANDGKMYNIYKIEYIEDDDSTLSYVQYMKKYYPENC